MLRRVADVMVQGKRQTEEDRKPGEKTHVRDIWKLWTLQSGIFNIPFRQPHNNHDGKSQGDSEEEEGHYIF